MNGSLVYQDYINLINKNFIIAKNINKNQIQPSSIDLSLSEECYEIKHSFLSYNSKVRNKLKDLAIKKINLSEEFIFKKNKTYIVRLNESLNLQKNVFGHCNPKSSTGRLDIFCRSLVDYAEEYEKIPKNYKGEIFLEITSRSFDIAFKKDNSLNQLRLINRNHNYLTDKQLINLNKKQKILIQTKNDIKIDNGLKLSVDLSRSSIVAYVAKKHTPVLNFSKIKSHIINDFWNKIYKDNKKLLIEKNKFYILRSKEKVRIPSNLAGEMIPYDTGIGDFRAHYAGFFDPGFGLSNGSYAVLEVKTNEVPFLLEDGQTIARIKYEKLNKNSSIVYGKDIKSNYQNQGLKLSKHFK
ncbi:2'-deoxycytidine 5'-triphosphate deaminase [Pelagibacteraceae bacterium]|nr:2'-deoxycytidine 5'-triphosphate deaminase [Pelagibacteraceae bacterium]